MSYRKKKNYSFLVDLYSRTSSLFPAFDNRRNALLNKSETLSVCFSRTTFLKSPYFNQIVWYHLEILKVSHVYVSFQNLNVEALKEDSNKAREEMKRIGFGIFFLVLWFILKIIDIDDRVTIVDMHAPGIRVHGAGKYFQNM